jgi:hypothetical protein
MNNEYANNQIPIIRRVRGQNESSDRGQTIPKTLKRCAYDINAVNIRDTREVRRTFVVNGRRIPMRYARNE